MRFDHHCIGLRTVPGPMDFVCGDAMKVSLLAQVTLVLDEEPDLAIQHVIDLFRDVLVRFRVIAWRTCSHHEAAFVTIRLLHYHRPCPWSAFKTTFFTGTFSAFTRSGIKPPSFSKNDLPHPSPLLLWRERMI